MAPKLTKATPPNYVAAGPALDAMVRECSGLEGQYSTDIARAFELYEQMSKVEGCAINLARPFPGADGATRYECSLVFSRESQLDANMINGYSDTAAGAVCACYVALSAARNRQAEKKKADAAKAPARPKIHIGTVDLGGGVMLDLMGDGPQIPLMQVDDPYAEQATPTTNEAK